MAKVASTSKETKKTLASYFLALHSLFYNISRPLRDVNFRINLTQGEQVTGRFYCICFPRINIILIHFLKHSGQKKGFDLLQTFFEEDI